MTRCSSPADSYAWRLTLPGRRNGPARYVSTLAAGAPPPVPPAPSPSMDDIHTEAADAWLRQIGKRVCIRRLTAEWTQDQLGQAAGISRSFVSLIEHGTHDCSVLRASTCVFARQHSVPT
jgi:hypothetical protein